jgi:hypothetical protein
LLYIQLLFNQLIGNTEQLKKNNNKMKNTNIIDVGKGLAIGLVIAIIFLWLRGCQSNTPQVAKTMKTKEVKGKFEAVKPNQPPITKRVPDAGKSKNYKESEIEKLLQGQIDELVFENDRLNYEFNKASDSIQKIMYDKAIELKSFNQTFEDDKLKADIFGLVRGEVQLLKLDYTIKPQTIELPKQKETFLRILAGGGVGINKELNQLTYKANLGFQNKKGNIISGAYQKIGSEEYFLAEYDFSVFNWKR